MINKIFNWTAGSFFRTLGRFVFYGLITAIIVFLFSVFNAKAATIEDYMEFGYYSNIGGKTFDNIKQYYVINNGVSTTLTSKLVFDIYESIEYTPDKQDYYYFTLDYCSTGDSTIYDVYPSYENKIYGIFNTNQNCNSSYGTTGKIFKMFVKLKLSYIDSFDTDLKYSLYFTPSWGLNNKIGYNVFLRFLDMQVMTYDNFVDLYNQYSDKELQEETNNKLDGIQNEQNQTNQELGEMNDYIQDDTPASTDDIDMDSLGTVSGLLPKGPVDSLLNIPFTFLSVLTSSMGGVCVPITGTFVFDSTLSIPCFDSFYDQVPDYLMNFVNLIPAGFILIMYFKHLYKKVERAVSLQTTTDDEWGVI